MPRLRLTEATLNLEATSIYTASSGSSIDTWITEHPNSPALYAREGDSGTEKYWAHLISSPLEISHEQGIPTKLKDIKRPHSSAPPIGPTIKRPKLAPTSGNRNNQAPSPDRPATPVMSQRRTQRTKGKENDALQNILPSNKQGSLFTII